MIVLKFQKYGTLWSYNGIPLYIGDKCITSSKLAWWWPVNWLAVLALGPIAAYCVIRKALASAARREG